MRRTIGFMALLFAFGASGAAAQDDNISFFITSSNPGDGADLGGIEGADAYCETLAAAAGLPDRMWRAYLSTTGAGGVNARDRIGDGPWFNHAGTMIARDVEHLHSNGPNLTKTTILTENGNEVNGRGDQPNQHDILTGTLMNGMAASDVDGDTTCHNWTSSGEGSALVGHHDRIGGGQNPTSWNEAHGSRGCSLDDLRGTGGDGRFYCFATDGPGGVGAFALRQRAN
ncbi:MAG: hypothetical protein F4164_07340 [Gemmatimonadales bacterium]|nr:hypothetical protein [Gemmatimonadales bacterium]MYG49172.1 hypothetical protein [Gemmatimonadales bacterium]MYK01806.1 hypothetical protein [Candidatus Palauibacter ramosifaciens]